MTFFKSLRSRLSISVLLATLLAIPATGWCQDAEVIIDEDGLDIDAPGGKIRIKKDGIDVDDGSKVRIREDSVDVVDETGDSVRTGKRSVIVNDGEAEVKFRKGRVSISVGRRATKFELAYSKPVVFACKGNQDKIIRRAYIKAKGDGVKVSGNCDFVIEDSYIEVSGFGIRAFGNAEVTVRNSTIIGRQGAAHISGNSELVSEGSDFQGRIVKRGNAEFEQVDSDD